MGSRSEETAKLLEPAPRFYEIVAGCVLAGFALLPFLLPLAIFDRFISRPGWSHLPLSQRIDDLTWAGGGLALGLMLMLLAVRMILGKSPRRDGGLFSPAFLRICGVVLAVMPFVLLLVRPWMVLKTALFWSTAAACFALASRRSEPAATKDSGPIG